MPPPGLLARATVTLPVKNVATLPKGSSAANVKPKVWPAVTLVGGGETTAGCVGDAAVTLKVSELDGGEDSPLLAASSEYPMPDLSSISVLKLARPLLKLAGVSARTLPPGLLARA